MAFHLTVAGSLEPLADALAAVLAEPLDDPFTPELIAVPGGGVQAWLVAQLAARLGATAPVDPDGPGAVVGDGIVANVDFVFPAGIVARSVGEGSGIGRWATGPLTWAVHEVLQELGPELGQATDAVRARAIADLFDRYTLYRPQMVRGWSDDRDLDGVGAPLETHQRWQPALWRAVQTHLGGPTDADLLALAAEALEAGDAAAAAGLPRRVALFGLASVPPAHLRLLAALARHLDVHVLAPTSSEARWRQVADQLVPPLRLPIRRGSDDEQLLVPDGGHPLVTSWGRASREANLLLLDQVEQQAGRVLDVPLGAPELPAAPSLLQRVQRGVRADELLAHDADRRPLLDLTDDRSLRWHRAYGPARQVEVLRDALLHLLEERDGTGAHRVDPRDIAVLCADVGAFAPLIEAAFAGDPDNGVMRIPVRVADRSLVQDNPLLDVAGALLDLLDGRFRSSSVLAFAARQPVGRRFGLDHDALATVAGWADATNVRWGLGPVDQAGFGLPAGLHAHTWRDGLDQLLVGATMAASGPRLGPGDVAPFPTIEAEAVGVLGSLAELVEQLDVAVAGLRTPGTVASWCDALSGALTSLCTVPDADAWQWRAVEHLVEEIRSEATVDGAARTTEVDPADLAALVRTRLAAGGGRPRFGTGAVTVSSLTAQRGVPHPVICLLGLDSEAGSGALPATDDLVSAKPCVGDRDQRAEQRAQLLDAVLAAEARLLLFSTGHDVRTNVALPPVVALAELIDVIDATVRTADGSPAHDAVTTDHPRQAWSEVALRPGRLGVDGSWSFDEGAKAAALARRSQATVGADFLTGPLPRPVADGDGPRSVPVDELVAACTNPAQALLRDRLGVSLPSSVESGDDQIPLDLSGLAEWKVVDDLLRVRLEADPGEQSDVADTWATIARRKGSVPPMAFGDHALDHAAGRVDGLLNAVTGELGATPLMPLSVPVEFAAVDGDGSPLVVTGQVGGVCGDIVLTITPSRLKAEDLLAAWVRLAVLTRQDPSRRWEAVTVGRGSNGDKAKVQRMALRSAEAADEALTVLLDLHTRVRCDAVPAFAETTRALHTGGPEKARERWEREVGGDRNDRWVALVFGSEFDALLALPRRDDERGAGWPADAESRLHCWADRLWGSVERTAELEERDPRPVAAEGEAT